MDKKLKDFLERFMYNQELLRSRYKFESASACALAAVESTARGRDLEIETLEKAEDLLKKETGIFSSYRGVLRIIVLSKLSSSRYPERLLKESLEVREILKNYFIPGDYTALLSLLLPELCTYVEEAVVFGKEIYEGIKRDHRFLTGGEDILLSCLIAATTKKDIRILDDIENCFRQLKDHIDAYQDSRQMVAEVLCMGERDIRFNIVRFLRLHDELKEAGYKVPGDMKLSSLAALALSEIPISDALDTIKQIDAFLAKQKPYKGIFSFNKRDRIAHSAALTSAYFSGYDPDNTALIALAVSMIAEAHAAAAAAAAA